MGGFQSVPSANTANVKTGLAAYNAINGAKATKRNNVRKNINNAPFNNLESANDPTNVKNSRASTPANTEIEVNALREVVENTPPPNPNNRANNSMAGGRRRKSKKNRKTRKGRK